jgi:hypothetical protein
LTPELTAAIKEHKADIIRIVCEDEEMRRTGTSSPGSRSSSRHRSSSTSTGIIGEERREGEENDGRCGVNPQDVLRAGLLFWFLVLCALASGVFFVLAIGDRDRPLAWYAAIAFILLCMAAVAELAWRFP